MKEERTLEEYKEEVFDKLNEEIKLKWLYELSKKCCYQEQALLDIKEYLKDKEKEFIDEPYYNNYWEYKHILDILNKALGGDDNE